jgi:hypothetical protein
MKLQTLTLAAALAASFMLASACSSNTAEHSPVASSDAGKGTAPAASEAKKADNALVRFVNATPTKKDLAFGDTTPFTGIGSEDVTAYQSIPAERHDFKLFLSGDATKTMATNSEGLSAGDHYTVLAVTEKDGTFKLDPINDHLTPPSPGKAKIRVINLAPGVKDVDLYSSAKNDSIISGAGLDEPTDYKEVDPADATLNVRNAMRKKEGVPVKDLNLEAGKLYTIIVFGDKSGHKLKVKTVEDVFTQAPNGTNS